MLDESIFNLLFVRYPHVLHNPSLDEYYKYAGDETIIVRKLISEAPPPYGQYRQVSLEKLLVDLFGRGISGSIPFSFGIPSHLRGCLSEIQHQSG